MKKIVIIGATGSLGIALRKELQNNMEYKVTLFSRNASKLSLASNEIAVNGSATHPSDLDFVIANQDLVFVALSGDLVTMANEIVASMKRIGTKRIIFVSSMGIYGEVAGNTPGEVPSILQPYRKSADIIEESGLEYTILRPGWFDNQIDTTCIITSKGELFKGHSISRKAIATLVKNVIDNPTLCLKDSIGIHR